MNHRLPDRIIVYRDGVGDGQLPVVAGYEVKQLSECFALFGETYEPRLAVIVVQKRINTRIFARVVRCLIISVNIWVDFEMMCSDMLTMLSPIDLMTVTGNFS